MTSLSHRDDMPLLIAQLHQATLGESPPLFELRLRTRFGNFLTIELIFVPQLAGGRVRSILGFARDVTERKTALRDLRAAKEAVEAVSHTKSEFLANVSHEIRTPLNAIVGMTSLLLDAPLESRRRAFAETIQTSSDALLTLIDDVLDFSKIESGRLELERQPFALVEGIQNAIDLVAPRASEKGLELSFTISEDCPMALEGDVTRVRQVLVNLLSNAVKFTEHGSVKVAVEARPRAAGEHEVRLAVTDTGIGIAPEKRVHIFDAFSQADASTTRGYGGTGLGLSISRRLTERMGGRLEVDSTVGKGSTFRFSFRARAVEEIASGRGRRAVARRKVDTQLGKKLPLRILVADDNPTNREVANLMLQKMGYVADLASNGQEVLEALDWRPYDVVLMDVHMPVLDGLEATRQIRRRWSAKEQPQVVAMTASIMRGDRELCIEAGMNDFLGKPVFDEDLQRALELCGERMGMIAPKAGKEGDSEPADEQPEDDEPKAGEGASGEPKAEEAEVTEAAEVGEGAGEDEPPTIDWAAFNRLADLPADRLAEAIRGFLETNVERLGKIRTAIEADDAGNLAETAHSLQDSCLTLSVARMGEICKRLETTDRDGSTAGAAEMLEELVREEEKVREALTEHQEARLAAGG